MNKKNTLVILVLLFILIVSFIFVNINSTVNNLNSTVNNCENLIYKFFQLYSENNYDEMKNLACDDFNKLYPNNLENGIFGIKEIKHIELENNYENEKTR